MALDIKIGDLVNSKSFNGVGKVTSISNEKPSIGICFFESPLSPESRTIEVSPTELIRHVLFEEAIVYCRDQDTELWRRARYGGQRPDDMHLLIFRGTETAVLPIAEIYVLNLASGSQFRPADFLAMRANDAMYYAPFRERFIKAYIAQRASCKSIASIPSSSVELEPHQIAVVRRVLQDPIPKYLLADEVGLGKTIEAGLIIREHLLEKKHDANVVVAVPKTLLDQWRQELKIRFHLGELFDIDNDDPELPLKIYAHDDLNEAIKLHGDPTLFVIDEAHQISQYAWSIEANKRNLFKQYSSACQASESVLLLSGTPLNGNEKNFLAMLHCLNHEAYSISEDGIRRFMEKVEEREQLGGLYSALTINNQNIAIEGILDQLALLFPDDIALIEHLNSVRPFVDFLARETGQDRDFAIRDLRKYIGDNYRLHQRMLRNRRENSGLAVLFPGLAGLIINKWQIDPYSLTVDELIEDYRNLALDNPNDFQGMSSDTYLKWIDDFLISPLCVSKRALHLLNAFNGSLQSVENEILRQLVEVSDREQIEKDDALITALSEWLRAHPDGKAVIFCGDPSVSLHVYEVLEVGLTRTRIEHYTNEHRPEFCQQGSDVRVFVCDYRGEDGLNLHGGRKLAVHYALTRSCSRIEQRLGRLNRYSANLKAVRPVESLIIIPDRDGLVNRWATLLDDAVQVFDRTIASLQFVLDEHLNKTWRKVTQSGIKAINESFDQLSGEQGILSLERKKVKVQEELLAMDEEVSLAAVYADEMIEADEEAEQQAIDMIGWITSVLQFKQIGALNGNFRFSFRGDGDPGARTLVDVRSFVATCLNGIDMNGAHSAKTSLMSVSRSQNSGADEVYPFRYGQPFVDAIWDLMQTDSRGCTTAYLRFLKNEKLPEVKICFRLGWLISANASGTSHVEQRIGDEKLCPEVEFHWLEEDGRPVGPQIQSLLDKPYTDDGIGYYDKSLRANVWKEISNWITPDRWQSTVLEIEKIGQNLIFTKSSLEGQVPPSVQLISMHATLLCSRETFTNLEP